MPGGRPPLPVGTWGTITVLGEPRTGGFRARARFRDADGTTRVVQRKGRTKGAARAALTQYMSERITPATDVVTGETRLRDVLERWLVDSADQHSVGTRRRYREVTQLHIGPALGALRVRETTVARLDAFLRTTTANVGAPTAKLCRTVLSGVLGLSVRHGALSTNPIRDTLPIREGGRTEVRALTLDEVAAIRRATMTWQAGVELPRGGSPRGQDLIDVVDVLLGTGARIGEVLALRWDDVDLDRSTVTISGTVVRGDHGMERKPTPKTDGSLRTLTLPTFAAAALLRRQAAMTVGNRLGLVFPSTRGTVRDPSNVRKSFRQVTAAAELTWVKPHTFRKTVATLLDAEANLATAAAQLGHSGQEVTRRHYVERSRMAPDMRAVLDALAPPDELTSGV